MNLKPRSVGSKLCPQTQIDVSVCFSGFRQLRRHSHDRRRALHLGPLRHGRTRRLRPAPAPQLPSDRRLPRLLLRRVAVILRKRQRKGSKHC